MKNKQKLIFWSKIRNIVIATIISIFTFSGLAYATYEVNKWTDTHTFYKVNNWTTKNIDRWTKCRKVTNNSWYNLFVPIKTNTEWYSFVAHKPSWVTILNECYIPFWDNIWSSYWRWGPWTVFQVCYHWYCVIGETAWESASIYRSWRTDRRPYTYYNWPWYKVNRWSLHHTSWGAYYYYVNIRE